MILATYKVTPSVQAYSGNPQQYPIPFPSILGACNRSLPSFWSPTGKALGWRQAGPWRHIASLRTEEISHIFRSTSGRIHPRPKAALDMGPKLPARRQTGVCTQTCLWATGVIGQCLRCEGLDGRSNFLGALE